MSPVVAFGIDWSKAFGSINWLLCLYVIVCITVVVMGSNNLYKQGQITATIFAIGSSLIFVLFGYRWFSHSKTTTSWPPIINTCPDYLTHVQKNNGTLYPNGLCVDMIGVSTNGVLQVSTQSEISGMANAVPSENKIFKYTVKDVAASAKNAAALQTICNECKDKGVTWEGVYDGDTCVAINTVSNMNAPNPACSSV